MSGVDQSRPKPDEFRAKVKAAAAAGKSSNEEADFVESFKALNDQDRCSMWIALTQPAPGYDYGIDVARLLHRLIAPLILEVFSRTEKFVHTGDPSLLR